MRSTALARLLPLTAAMAALAAPALADPCGLVPPKGLTGPVADSLTRKGVQYTYVFFQNGVQDVVLRPAFEGKVSEFGMLIPFQSPPAIRKVSDEIFGQLEATVKPPVITHTLNPPRFPTGPSGPSSGGLARGGGAPTKAQKLSFDTVRVVSQEAMGMYQVAVLEAGSAQALEKWMNEHGYVYPKGMAGVVNEYVAKRWCFVAVKARVGQKAGVSPKPGMRTTTPALPEGAVFKGAVQAMGFRFRTTEPVVPMRLSAHNPGKLHNRCFILTEQGVRFAQLDRAMVQTQISGPQLVTNLTKALPCKLTYWYKAPSKGEGPDGPPWGTSTTLDLAAGEEPDLPAELVKQYQAWAARGRDPHPMNGTAKDLFLSDLLSAGTGRLLHHFEERHKTLTNVSVALGQRGPHSDQIVEHALTDVRDAALRGMLEELAKMTLTVIDGEFPREVIRDDDLTLLCWTPGSGKDSPGPRVETPVAEPAHEEKPGGGAGVANDPMRTVWDREAKLELRGQALVAVVGRGDGSDWKRLERVARDSKEQQLVRFWAVGAMGKMKPGDTVTLLLSGAAGRGVEADAWSWDDAKLRKGRPELHRALAGYLKTDIGERAPHHLLGVLLGHGNDNVRRAAAAYFADTSAARAVLQQALAYDPERAAASGVPWKGGALFLPAGSYTSIEAADLVHALVHWQLWIEHDGPGAQAGSRVVKNNVFSLSRRYGVMAADWNASGATMAIAWSKRWAEQGRPFEAAELLVHAYEKGGKLKDAVRLELTRIAGKDRGADAAKWRSWLEELRAKRK